VVAINYWSPGFYNKLTSRQIIPDCVHAVTLIKTVTLFPFKWFPISMQYANPKSFISSCNTNTREKIKALAKPDEKHLHLRRSQRDRMAHFGRIKKRTKESHAQKKQKERA
jgi:hypothetical protein